MEKKKVTKFKLGPIQQKWIAELKAHPERQMSRQLGVKEDDGSYKMCCLGQYLVCYNQMRAHRKIWEGNRLIDDDGRGDGQFYLSKSWEKLGLRNPQGGLKEKRISDHTTCHSSLAEMNDGGVTWPEIAQYIEQNPENVFTKSI